MFGTYLRRELAGRRRQTAIIAIGMALAIALVIIVNAVSGGVQTAQASVLKSVYGVGTDVTVTQKATASTAAGPQQFGFGSGSGTTSGGTQSVNKASLSTAIGSTAFSSSALSSVKSVSNVKSAAATLSLTNTKFSGTLPNFSQSGGRPSAPTGGADGKGGSSFSINSFTVMGLNPSAVSVGPLSSVKLTSGHSFTSADADSRVAVLNATYATSTKTKYKVGDSISIAGKSFSIIGIVKSTSSSAATAANVYIPLTVAQTLSKNTGKVTDIYVTAASSADITQVKAGIEKALPKATVSTQADLASSVSGSLATASSLVSNLGTWLSIIVLAAAFLIAILFTISGVTRRTREFGTLKAIGWSNGRIVRQVAGESLVQGLIGGVIGVAVGLVGIVVVNAVKIKLGASTATTTAIPGGGLPSGAPGGAGGLPSFGAAATSATTNVILSASVTVWIIVIAVALAVLGGLLAGAIGGWRASRLRPAEALRSIA